MKEIRIWINGEDSINLVTNLEVEIIEDSIKSFKSDISKDSAPLETYLTDTFGNEITIIPRNVFEIEFYNL